MVKIHRSIMNGCRDNHPDFDFFIEDNYFITDLARKNLPPDKTFVLTDYLCNRNTTGSNIYHLKTSVSDLKNEDIVKAAEQYRQRQTEQKAKLERDEI